MIMPTLPAWYKPLTCCGRARLTARPSIKDIQPLLFLRKNVVVCQFPTAVDERACLSHTKASSFVDRKVSV